MFPPRFWGPSSLIVNFLLLSHSLPKPKMLTFTAVTLLALLQSATAATNVTSTTAPVGAEVLTVAVIGGSCRTLHPSSDIYGR